MPGDTLIDFDLDGIGHLLSDRKLAVPIYQRSYAWTKDEIGDFCSDLRGAFDATPQEYFLGTVVLSAEGTEGRVTIIDGQQRIATTCLLMAALRDLHRSRGENKRANNFHQLYIGSYDDEEDEDVPHIVLNDEDDEFFRERFVRGNTGLEPTRKSHELLVQAYNLLLDFVTDLADSAGDEWVNLFVKWRAYLHDQVRVIFVKVPTESDAFMIFETLNDRGADLTLADLLKNYLFGRAGSSRLTKVRDHWMMAQSSFDLDTELFVTFIRHYWSSVHGPTREHLLYKDIKREVTSGPKALAFAKALEDSSRLYAALLNSDHDHWSDWGTSTKDNIETLGRLSLEQNRPMLLAALERFPRAEMKKTLRATVNWSVRGLIVGGIGGGTTEKAYASAAVKIREAKVRTAFQLMKELQSIIPSDTEFRSSFETARVTKSSLSRYYLIALERHSRGDPEPELVPNANEEEVNLEHVLPKNADQPEWPGFTKEELKDLVNRLGNQALLKKSHNRRIGNKPFSRKKPILASSDLTLTKSIGTEADWTPAEIAKRQGKLATLAPKVWKRRP